MHVKKNFNENTGHEYVREQWGVHGRIWREEREEGMKKSYYNLKRKIGRKIKFLEDTQMMRFLQWKKSFMMSIYFQPRIWTRVLHRLRSFSSFTIEGSSESKNTPAPLVFLSKCSRFLYMFICMQARKQAYFLQYWTLK